MANQRSMPKYRLGIDLGGTKMHAVVIDRKGKVLASTRRPTKPEGGYKSVLMRLMLTAHEVAEEAGLRIKDLPAIGLGMPGPIDVKRGMVHLAPNLGWRERTVAADLKKLVKRPVVLGNDVNFGCLSEVAHGCATGATSAFAAFVGTGLGGGVVEAMGHDLLPLVRKGMEEFSMSYRERKPDLRLAALGDDAVAIGAAVASTAEA